MESGSPMGGTDGTLRPLAAFLRVLQSSRHAGASSCEMDGAWSLQRQAYGPRSEKSSSTGTLRTSRDRVAGTRECGLLRAMKTAAMPNRSEWVKIHFRGGRGGP